jgi:hypothetical protein
MEQRVNDTDFFYARDMGITWEITTIVVRLEELTTKEVRRMVVMIALENPLEVTYQKRRYPFPNSTVSDYLLFLAGLTNSAQWQCHETLKIPLLDQSGRT